MDRALDGGVAAVGRVVRGVAVGLPGAVQQRVDAEQGTLARAVPACPQVLAAGGRVGQLAGVAEGAGQRRALGRAVRVVAGAGGDVPGVVEQLPGAAEDPSGGAVALLCAHRPDTRTFAPSLQRGRVCVAHRCY